MMSRPLKVTAVSGSYKLPSRTAALVEAITQQLGKQLPIDLHLIELSEISSSLVASYDPKALPLKVQKDIQAIETADLLVVATPVYRASYTGLFKHLFDLVDYEALVDVPVLLAATGGSERHALIIDHELRPLFSFFQALTLPIGVYATEADFENYQVKSEAVTARIALAVERALPLLKHRELINKDRLLAV
ncbi:FMN reductase, putative [Ricinus communis]|uniref:NAD(P)H dehydrogenase (quinone) n=1 Tax=Ricinus communis TaxID=3988 RepID=B9TG77_RICCO|nr:FMN reductase, putative [Ricinus communis]